MSEKPKIPLTSRAGIIAKMGAAKHNQQVITKKTRWTEQKIM